MRIFFILSFLLLASTIVDAQNPDRNRVRRREIVDVRFEGNSSISTGELQSIIASRPSGGFESFLYSINSDWGFPPQFIDESIQSHDTLVIFSYYRDHGFLEAKVTYSLRESPESVERFQKVFDENRLLAATARKPYPNISDTVVFTVVEGKPYNVDFFTFEGTESLPPNLLEEVTSNISIKRGSRYTRQQFADEISRFKHILEENGYLFFSTHTDPEVRMDTVRKTVKISASFKPGPRIKNGESHIYYDTSYLSRGFVRNSALMRQVTLDRGEWSRLSDIQTSERQIAQLGVFELWRVTLDTSAYAGRVDSIKDGTELPVQIFLRMRPTADITPGIFVGVGSSSVGSINFGVSGAYSNLNIFNGAENFTLQASYQLLPRTQDRYSAGGQLTFPYVGFRNLPLILSSNYSYSKVDPSIPNAYLEKIIDAKAGSYIVLSQNTTHRLTLAPEVALEYVERIFYDTALKTGLLDKNPQFNVIASTNAVWDWTNDFLNPSKGSVISYQPQITLPFFAKIFPTSLPSASYIKNTLQFKTYFDASNRGVSVFAFRIYGGLITLSDPGDSTRDISIERRFNGGGTNSLRAWPTQSLLVSNDTSLNRPKLGGYKAIEANLEWRYAPFQYSLAIGAMQQFLSDVRLALFLDVGNVWDRTVEPSLKSMAAAIGFGIRYNTLFGAIRFDFGFKLYDPYPTLKGDNVVAIPPNSTGVWLFNRKPIVLGDIFHFSFALGQPF